MKKKILDIQQFRGVRDMTGNNRDPFVNCFYTPLLSVLEFYGKEISSIIFAPSFYYEHIFKIAKPTGYLRVTIKESNSFEKLFDDLGLEMIGDAPSVNEVFDYIRTNIDDNLPVFIKIDMFYQIGREFYYNTRHDAHYILIYGYDDINKKIYFLDDVQGYDEYNTSYEEFRKYYQGVFDHCDLSDNNWPTAYILKPIPLKTYGQPLDEKSLKINQLKDFALASYKNKPKILKGLKKLKKFIKLQDDIKNDEIIVEALNSTVQRKISQKYQYKYLIESGFVQSEEGENLILILDPIIANWNLVRNIVAKGVFKGRVTEDNILSIKELLKRIYQDEVLLQEKIVLIFQNILEFLSEK